MHPEVLETAYQLHAEIRKRGLELRRGRGRDDQLLRDLAANLSLSDSRFSAELREADLTAEDYLRSFLAVARPFAQMFTDIWEFLGRHAAPGAQESIKVRFGFNRDRPTTVDLEQFRIYEETARVVTSQHWYFVWRTDELHMLFDLRSKCFPNLKWRGFQPEYRPGEPYSLPTIVPHSDLDQIAARLRSVLQSAINFSASIDRRGARQFEPLRRFAHLDDVKQGVGESDSADRIAIGRVLHDLIPAWRIVLADWHQHNEQVKRSVVAYFKSVIEPRLPAQKRLGVNPIRKALDILELPFWRHRWHTYEIWATVITLQALEKYDIQPIVKNGRIAIDGIAPATVATIGKPTFAYVGAQAQTSITSPRRRNVRPDLRISMDVPPSNKQTTAIIEFKQRKKLDKNHVKDVMACYLAACGLNGGVVMANYDDAPELADLALPPLCTLTRNVRPGEALAISQFKTAILEAAHRGGFPSISRLPECVLLDVSLSMKTEFSPGANLNPLKQILLHPSVEVYCFNTGLVSSEPLRNLDKLECFGATDLARALTELRKIFDNQHRPFPDRLLLITDGDYGGKPSESYGAEIIERRIGDLGDFMAGTNRTS